MPMFPPLPGIVFSERTPLAQRRPSPPRSDGYQRQKSVPAVTANDRIKEENGGKQNVENPVEGMIFGCNKKTKEECKRLQLFGLPATHRKEVLRVIPGSKLFLFNYDSKHLSGVFEATCHGAMDIFPHAFRSIGSFPAQVKIKRVMKVPSITMDKLKEAIPEIFYNEKKFKFELSRSQVEKLVELLVAAKEIPAK
ncbi:hypothetical protein O6H91_15G020900 [Diphasiastrum complanatum]|uniref:Uncharacterized protein n=1 Tax=Diphasiastrum complanatum TaxID=34168 RepID=A0ACC2BGB6_DIPCM|nr:hypothetical protein O6H91_15G020900 [Diphasiastrum complanatum]